MYGNVFTTYCYEPGWSPIRELVAAGVTYSQPQPTNLKKLIFVHKNSWKKYSVLEHEINNARR